MRCGCRLPLARNGGSYTAIRLRRIDVVAVLDQLLRGAHLGRLVTKSVSFNVHIQFSFWQESAILSEIEITASAKRRIGPS